MFTIFFIDVNSNSKALQNFNSIEDAENKLINTIKKYCENEYTKIQIYEENIIDKIRVDENSVDGYYLIKINRAKYKLFKKTSMPHTTMWSTNWTYEIEEIGSFGILEINFDENCKIDGDLVKNINDELTCIKIIRKKPDLLRYLTEKQQTNIVCKEAININPFNIKYVIDQKEDICLLSISKNWCTVKYIKKENFTDKIVQFAAEVNIKALKYIDYQPVDIMLKIVNKNWRAIEFIKNRTIDHIMAAVEQNGKAIKLIEDLSKDIAYKCVTRDIKLLKYITNQDEYFYVEIVDLFGYRVLEYIDDKCKTFKINKMAVEQSWKALEFISNADIEIVKEGLDQNTSVLIFIDHQRSDIVEILEYALKLDPNAHNYIETKYITQQLQYKIIEYNPYLIKNLKCQPHDLCKNIVNKNGMVLQHIIFKTKEICEIAVKNNGLAIQFVDFFCTEELCFEAVKNDYNAIVHISIEYQSDRIWDEVIKNSPIRYISKYIMYKTDIGQKIDNLFV